MGDGLAKLGDAVKAKSEVITLSGKTLRARRYGERNDSQSLR